MTEDKVRCSLCKREFPEEHMGGQMCLRCDSIWYDSVMEAYEEREEQ